MPTRVLVVDDDPVQRRLLEAMIRRFEYEPVLAEGGEQALLAFSTHPMAAASLAWCSTSSCPISTVSACSAGLRERGIDMPVIVQTAQGSIDTVVSRRCAPAPSILP